jgi:hypothetical protein
VVMAAPIPHSSIDFIQIDVEKYKDTEFMKLYGIAYINISHDCCRRAQSELL